MKWRIGKERKKIIELGSDKIESLKNIEGNLGIE